MFSFNKDYILRNDTVELSPLLKKHEEALFVQANDAEIWRHFEENGLGKDNFERYIDKALAKREKNEEYPFIIKDLRNDTYAGITRLYALNESLKNVKIGHTWIGKQFQGTGLNKNCKFLLFEFLFEKLKIERVGFGASEKNIRSIRAMESIGCKQEGRLRSFLPDSATGERLDIVLLSILKQEWMGRVKQELGAALNRGPLS